MKRSLSFTAHRLRERLSLVLLIITLSPTHDALSLDFGIFDARTLAMGGAAVASASSEAAIFYNPALLALYDGQEEDTRNGRFVLPSAVIQGSTSVADLLEEDLGQRIDEAITVFNANANAQTGAEASAALASLSDLIEKNKKQNVLADTFIGIAVSEPADRTGGSFYYGERLIIGGNSNVTDSDLELLVDYIEVIDFLTPGGAAGVSHPELLNADGQLLDPGGLVTSDANISGLRVRELGMALAKEFEFMDMPVAFGITPKFIALDAYRDNITYGDRDIDLDRDKQSHVTFNADLGLAVQVNPFLKIALASKDVFPKTYEAGNGLSITTQARTRLGASLDYRYLTIAADIDLQENIPLGQILPTREAYFGIELRPVGILRMRGGFREDLNRTRENIISAGIGIKLGRFLTELSAAKNDQYLGGSLFVGWAF